jgi:hypothetical protein
LHCNLKDGLLVLLWLLLPWPSVSACQLLLLRLSIPPKLPAGLLLAVKLPPQNWPLW